MCPMKTYVPYLDQDLIRTGENTNRKLLLSFKASSRACTLVSLGNIMFNETFLLEFACGILVENKGIEVNWVAYAYLVYKKQ